MAGGWFKQVARATSRMLNAVCGGDGDTTFSAGSYDLVVRGSPWGPRRVRFVDGLPFNAPGHCEEAWGWHVLHGLLEDPRRPEPQIVPPPSMAPPPPKGA